MALGVLCISIPILFVAGIIAGISESQDLDNSVKLGRRFRFEAAFRDNNTQKRFFGNLDSVSNPWCGYYVADDMASWYKHLIVNAGGDIWLYRTERNSFLLDKGIGHQSLENPKKFIGEMRPSTGGKDKLSLERIDIGNFILRIHTNYPDTNAWRQYGGDVHLRKSLPSRYPATAPQTNPVKFLGVFSARFVATGKQFKVFQVWLWESRGAVRGRLLQSWFTQGELKQFLWTIPTEGKCSEDCRVIDLSTSSKAYPLVLTKISDDRYAAPGPTVGGGVVLTRGETVPGYLYDLAPLESEIRNREWLNAVSREEDAEWNVPID
jgi:hypothetical protein